MSQDATRSRKEVGANCMAEMASIGGFASSNWALGCQCEIRRVIEVAYLRTDMSEESKEREGLYINLCRE